MTAQATPFAITTEVPPAPREPGRTGRALDLAVLSSLVAAAALVVAVVMGVGIPVRFSGHVLALIQLTVGASLVAGSRRVDRSDRGAWATIGIGVIAVGAGQLIRSTLAPVGTGFGLVPDVLAVGFYPLVCLGLLRLPAVRTSGIGVVRMSMDVFVAMVATTTVLWEFDPGVLDTGVARPLLHVLLLGCVLVAFVRRSPYVNDARLGLLLAGLLPIVTIVEPGPTSAASWTGVRWAIAMMLLATAAWRLGIPQARRSMILARAGKRQFVIPTVPLIAFGSLLAWRVVDGVELADTLIPWGTLLLAVGIAVRSIAAIVESRHLLALERDQLLASISHELRTPLTAVSGFSQILTSSWDVIADSERRELVELIGSESNSLVDIVGDMNALARSELDAVALTLERIVGKQLLGDAIRLVFKLDGPLPIKAEVEPYLELICDRRRTVQALRALFENALRYGNGRILVVAKRTKTGRVIEVHDNGSGVERRHERVIWKRFERGEHQLNANVPGSGLGLAVVRAIARAHGGDASYRRSDRLSGACFSIELPYDRQADLRSAAAG